jgi:hypothetical protein
VTFDGVLWLSTTGPGTTVGRCKEKPPDIGWFNPSLADARAHPLTYGWIDFVLRTIPSPKVAKYK